jgi:putative hydrolase of the HAD superfamily
MIDAIIFDFGDVFINLNKKLTTDSFKKLGLESWNDNLENLNFQFEVGAISETAFLEGIQKEIPNASIENIKTAWNTILADFPKYRLDFVKKLSQEYRLFLLSNTDAIHISNFEKNIGQIYYKEFYACFEKIYFSFELGLRKPDPAIYTHVLKEQKLKSESTLFVDDKKENTDAAAALGINVWELQVGQEDVIDLFIKNLI